MLHGEQREHGQLNACTHSPPYLLTPVPLQLLHCICKQSVFSVARSIFGIGILGGGAGKNVGSHLTNTSSLSGVGGV